MGMTIQALKQRIESLANHVLFDYNGKTCGVDPFNAHHFEMWYGDQDYDATSIDDIMNARLFDGKSLTEIFDQIENIEI